jgi:hypothetical protein
VLEVFRVVEFLQSDGLIWLILRRCNKNGCLTTFTKFLVLDVLLAVRRHGALGLTDFVKRRLRGITLDSSSEGEAVHLF